MRIHFESDELKRLYEEVDYVAPQFGRDLIKALPSRAALHSAQRSMAVDPEARIGSPGPRTDHHRDRRLPLREEARNHDNDIEASGGVSPR